MKGKLAIHLLVIQDIALKSLGDCLSFTTTLKKTVIQILLLRKKT